MHFIRHGKAFHADLQTAADLAQACELDESLWVATAAPVDAFSSDPEFLRCLDLDGDGRVKAGELKSAIRWTLDVLVDHRGVDQGADTLEESSVSPEHPDGVAIRDVVQRLARERKSETTQVALSDIRKLKQVLEESPVSERGIVLPDATDNALISTAMDDMITTLGGVEHPSGKKGLDAKTVSTFHKTAEAHLDWLHLREARDENGRSCLCPLGEDMPRAWKAYVAVREPLARFFALCDGVALDPELIDRVWPGGGADVSLQNEVGVEAWMRTCPLAKPNAEGLLHFGPDLNPAYAHALSEFRHSLIVPLLDRTDEVLARSVFLEIETVMDAYGTWQEAIPGAELERLGGNRIRELLAPGISKKIHDLLDTHQAAALDLAQLRLVEKVILFQAGLLDFCNNFISFPLLYDPARRALFEEGSLTMDGRCFHLAVRVPDRKRHLAGVESGSMFVMYVKLEHKQRGETREVAIPGTWGSQGNLRVGKHGVFRHVDGSEWFATIEQICDRPISLTEAIFDPFKRLIASLTRKVESITQTAEKNLEKAGGDSVVQVQTLASAPPQAAPAPASGPGNNLLAGGGIAIAAIGSSLAFMTKTLAGLNALQIVSGLGAALLAVLVPSTLIAWIRLGQRDLSGLLEGSGWAINASMRLSRTQRRTFTQRPHYPEQSRFSRGSAWWLWRVLLLVALLAVAVLWR